MEEKIVGKKRGGIFPLFPHLFHSLIYRISLICSHPHCACARHTTPLWFIDSVVSVSTVGCQQCQHQQQYCYEQCQQCLQCKYQERNQKYGGNSSSFSMKAQQRPRNQVALLPKLKTKDKAKSVSFFGKATNQNCALLPAPSFLHSASPLFTLALAQIICKNLSYFPRIVERECQCQYQQC